MSLGEISETSIVVTPFRVFHKWCSRLRQKADYIYHDSRTSRLAGRLWENIKVYFEYSFLGRITEIKQTAAAAPLVLDDSRTVQYLIDFYNRWKTAVVHCSRASLATELARDTKEELNLSTVRTVGIIIGVAVVANVFLSLLLQKQIGLWGWLMRGLFLFVAIASLFCKSDWSAVKSSSIFLTKIGIT